MTNLKLGEIGYMKLTGEPAFIIEVGDEEGQLGPRVLVRLTGTSKKGPATYPTMYVRMAELESLEERASRDFHETERLQKLGKQLMEAKQQLQQAAPTKAGELLN